MLGRREQISWLYWLHLEFRHLHHKQILSSKPSFAFFDFQIIIIIIIIFCNIIVLES